MSRDFATRLETIAPSATLEMAARAQKLRSEGHKVYPFSVGEPDFPTPAHIREAAKAALDQGATRYTAVTGTPELKAAICASTERHRGYRPEPSQIVVSSGAKHALFNLALALYQPGDEVVIPAPCWVSYPEQVRIVGATPVLVPTREEEGFRVRPDALEAALSPRTKAVILNSPSNPTGAAYPREALLPLLEVLTRTDAYIIVDEIYAELVYDGFVHASLPALLPQLRDRIIIVDGVSKTFAMTGWRIGWTIASPALTRVLDVVQSQSTSSATAVSQAAATAALSGPRDELVVMRDAFARRRNLMVEGLRSIPGVRCRVPEGAFYAFPDIRGLFGKRYQGVELRTDGDVASWLLDDAHVAAVAGEPFGGPGYLRMSYACSEDDIREGIGKIRERLAVLS
jgi:aspartate aminotransferase